MALRFPCPTCKRELSGPESLAGAEVQCPSCKSVFLAGDRRLPGDAAFKAAHSAVVPMPVGETANPFRNRAPGEDDTPPVLTIADRPTPYRPSFLTVFLLSVLAGGGGLIVLSLMTIPMTIRPPPPTAPPLPALPSWQTFQIPH